MSQEPIYKELSNLEEADWVREMRQYYQDHGTYRVEDIYKLLGNPIQGVLIPTSSCDNDPYFLGQCKKGRLE